MLKYLLVLLLLTGCGQNYNNELVKCAIAVDPESLGKQHRELLISQKNKDDVKRVAGLLVEEDILGCLNKVMK